MKIKVTKSNFNNLIKNIKLNYTTVVTILICIVVVIIPILFLPYIYNATNQIKLTYFFTILTSLVILALKISEIIKLKKKRRKNRYIKKIRFTIFKFVYEHICIVDSSFCNNLCIFSIYFATWCYW